MGLRSVYERNMLALSLRQSELGGRLSYIDEAPDLSIHVSKTGLGVPSIRRQGRDFPLHSLFDPEREAERMLDAGSQAGFFLVFGFGGGHHLRRILASPACSAILVIDFGMDIFRAAVSGIEVSDIFSDPRLHILIDPEPEEIEARLLSLYIPFISGDFKSLSLRSRVDLDRHIFEAASESVHAALARISDDYTVQSNFGKIWFKNTIGNLRRAEESVRPLQSQRRVLIAAAGPSLEAQAGEIERRIKEGDFLIATDTTLPFFLKTGIAPGAIITLDCQRISYYHFMEGYPQGTPLVIDLASPPLVARLASPLHFFSSGHPFCRYIAGHWRSFPSLDTSGGNVTHAALSLASRLGAREIRLYGADFSYPRGKSYARGTYIYRYFDIRSSRTQPLEAHFSDFLFRNPSLIREEDEFGYRYLTKPLIAYRQHLEQASASLSARFIPLRGEGAAIRVLPSKAPPLREDAFQLFAPGPAKGSSSDFLASYAQSLAALELPSGNERPLEYIRSLPEEKRDIWTTIFPQAAALSRTRELSSLRGRELLVETREWTLSRLKDCL